MFVELNHMATVGVKGLNVQERYRSN